MYERYRASFGEVVWYEIKWNFKLFKKALPDLIAGIAFGGFFVLLPILAGFIIG